MSCGCGERMRKYILPFAGYTFVDGNWVNLSEENEDLRIIPDAEVNKHHSRLTVKIMYSFGRERFKSWWTSIYGSPVEDTFLDRLEKKHPRME